MSAKELRNTLDLTQAGAARICGVNIRTWQRWEAEEQGMHPHTMRLIEILRWLHENHLLDKCIEETRACEKST